MSEPKSALRPAQKRRVIDLVRAAGVDVSDWANYERGTERAAANPKYCYEWCFVHPGKVIVLNLWYDELKRRDGSIVLDLNPRRNAQMLAQQGGKAVWRKRSEKLDEALQMAFREKLPVRAIICDGRRRDREDPFAEASQVRARDLDPMPWSVSRYNFTTGQCRLARGPLPEWLVDQFDAEEESASAAERRPVHGEAFVRDPDVRRRVLERAEGKCEWCGAPGFVMDDGRFFLETHHVTPLSEEGRDTVSNVAALCANHHREAHYGAGRIVMREELLRRIRRKLQS